MTRSCEVEHWDGEIALLITMFLSLSFISIGEQTYFYCTRKTKQKKNLKNL